MKIYNHNFWNIIPALIKKGIIIGASVTFSIANISYLVSDTSSIDTSQQLTGGGICISIDDLLG